MTENLFNAPLDMAGQSSVGVGGALPFAVPNPFLLSTSFEPNNQSHRTNRLSVSQSMQELTTDQQHVNAASSYGFDPNTVLASIGRNYVGNASFCSSTLFGSFEFQDQVPGGEPISAVSLAASYATSDLQERPEHPLQHVSKFYHPLGDFRSYSQNQSSDTPSPAYKTSETMDNINSKWGRENFAGAPCKGFMENVDLNAFLSSDSENITAASLYGSSRLRNNLSLSLSTSESPLARGTSVAEQGSEMSYSSVTQHCFSDACFSTDQTSSHSKELSLSFGSYRPQCSQAILDSRFLSATQELLDQIASCWIENLEKMSYPSVAIGAMPFSLSSATEGSISQTGHDQTNGSDTLRMSEIQRQASISKKTLLLNLLQLVDDQYNRCMDEIHTVVSAFHSATELDPQLHTRFVLQTISLTYRHLRQRISNYILAIGVPSDALCMKEKERSFEMSFIQKQWALQQLKRKDNQLWRPQRGLPERSVSVLRAWMFQNFLHPYPKDTEKHLLAVKSGLTRSQVSNWFINARVRLWKPMIEEMCAEMNRRKSRANEEGIMAGSGRCHASINSQRFGMN